MRRQAASLLQQAPVARPRLSRYARVGAGPVARRFVQLNASPALDPTSFEAVSEQLPSSAQPGSCQLNVAGDEIGLTQDRCTFRSPRLSVLPPVRLAVGLAKPLHSQGIIGGIERESGECSVDAVSPRAFPTSSWWHSISLPKGDTDHAFMPLH
jgi:hypothetical protein